MPYRLPCASSTTLKGYVPSPPVPVKLWSTVSLPVASNLNTVPQPYKHSYPPPPLVVPYRLPCASRTRVYSGYAPSPSPPVPVKLYSTVSLPVASTSNTVPALVAPPCIVVPYRLPCASCTKPATGNTPSVQALCEQKL